MRAFAGFNQPKLYRVLEKPPHRKELHFEFGWRIAPARTFGIEPYLAVFVVGRGQLVVGDHWRFDIGLSRQLRGAFLNVKGCVSSHRGCILSRRWCRGTQSTDGKHPGKDQGTAYVGLCR